MRFGVVSYRNSTSNHNIFRMQTCECQLYLIEIPHQTTTSTQSECKDKGCILSKFHIKPQLQVVHCLQSCRCILSKFHIKPQRSETLSRAQEVVSYRNSTSNHNFAPSFAHASGLYLIEIPHQTTTNLCIVTLSLSCILSKFHIKPQRCCGKAASTAVVSYRNSTSNHNSRSACCGPRAVVSYRNSTSNHNSCLCISEETAVVSYRNSTSNHNVGPHID